MSLRNSKYCLVIAACICWAISAAAQVLAPPPMIIRHVTLIDGTGSVQKDVDVKIFLGRIQQVGANLTAEKDEREIDGTGKFVIPGFIDTRVQISASPANKIMRAELGNEQRVAWLHSLLRMGVTTGRFVQSDLEELKSFKHWRELDQLNGPGVVISGPTLTALNGLPAVEYGMLGIQTRGRETSEVNNEDQARQAARNLAHNGGEVFEVSLTSGPGAIPTLTDVEMAAILKEAHGHDLKAFCWVGTNDEAKKAVAQGCDVIEGLTEEVFSDDVLKEMGAKHIPYLPAMVYQGYVVTHFAEPDALKALVESPEVKPNLTPLIHQSLEANRGQLANLRAVMPLPVTATQKEMNEAVAGKSPTKTSDTPQNDATPVTFIESYRQQLNRTHQNVKKAKAAGVPVLLGTSAGTVLNFPGSAEHLELSLLVDAGLSPMEAIQAASRNAAAAMGLDKENGTLENGKWADFVVLDADPLADIHNTTKISAVVRHGKIVNRDNMYEY